MIKPSSFIWNVTAKASEAASERAKEAEQSAAKETLATLKRGENI